MAELQTRTASATTRPVDTKDSEDRNITALRKTYEEAAKAVTAAATHNADPLADLRAKKTAAFKALHDAEDAQGKRIKAEAVAARGGRPPTV